MSERDPISSSSRDYGATTEPPTVGFVDFSPAEIYNLSESIANNINSINSGLKTLEKYMKQIGGPNDNVQLRDRVHDTQQSINSSVSATARDLQRYSVVVRRGDKPQKLQLERLTQAFKDMLTKYSTVQKQVSEKMAAHIPKQSRIRNDQQSLEQQAMADDEESVLIANQQTQIREAQFQTGMLLDKESHLNQIEADVLDVNQIMRDLADYVKSQSEAVDSLETHVEAASADVEIGREELAKAAEHKRSLRRKLFILIIIGIIFAILFIVWIVRSFR